MRYETIKAINDTADAFIAALERLKGVGERRVAPPVQPEQGGGARSEVAAPDRDPAIDPPSEVAAPDPAIDPPSRRAAIEAAMEERQGIPLPRLLSRQAFDDLPWPAIEAAAAAAISGDETPARVVDTRFRVRAGIAAFPLRGGPVEFVHDLLALREEVSA